MRIKPTLFLIVFLSLTSHAQKRTVDVDNFSKVSLGIPADLYLTQGSDEKLEIDCSDALFKEIEFELRNDRLVIKNRNAWSWKKPRGNIDIYITMKDVEGISISGSGEIIGQNQIKSDELDLSVSGSGDIKLHLSAKNLEIRISGSGNFYLEGSAGKTKARINGSGKVRADKLKAQSINATINGSGNVYMNVSEEINARISGSGNIYYSGNPKRVIANSSGSGKVRKI